MIRAVRSHVVILLVLVLTCGCQMLTGKTLGENVDDASLTTSVKAKLVADRAVNLTRVDVDTNRGVVSLNGTVRSAEEKSHVERLAREVDGVKRVINNLEVAR